MDRTSPALTGAVALLERAISYTLGSLQVLTQRSLARPTPCPDWDVRALLCHLTDALDALHWAGTDGTLDLASIPPVADPIVGVRDRARDVLEAWAGGGTDTVLVGENPLSAVIVVAAGAIEVAVHGWDVARAGGLHRPIPEPLADEMLDLVPLVVMIAERRGRFAAPIAVPPDATASDRLIAFLGRRPLDPAERRYLQSRAALLLTSGP